MNTPNIPEDKLGQLLEIAGKKLGRDPAQLRSELESGKLDGVLGSMNPKAANQMNSLLKNPAQAEALLNNDKIKNLLNGILGGKK